MSEQSSIPTPVPSAVPPPLPVFHVNVCRISATLEEFVLDFGYRAPVPGAEAEPIPYACRLVMPPRAGRELMAALRQGIAHQDKVRLQGGRPPSEPGQPGAASG
jgi:hypothetical protein